MNRCTRGDRGWRRSVVRAVVSVTLLASGLGLALAGVVTTVAAPPAGAAVPTAGTMTAAYNVLGIDHPMGIAAGPDGNLWFANSWNHSIGRVTPDGVVTRFTGTGMRTPRDIAAGPDGALWFVNTHGGTGGVGSIGRISTAGAVTIFGHAAISDPTAITAGPDGALWFTNRGVNSVASIGRITTAGSFTFFPTGPPVPNDIVTGPDGNLWFSSGEGFGSYAIGRVTTGGVVTVFTGPGIDSAGSIAAGPDGALWFTNGVHGTIGRITTAGVVSTFGDGTVQAPLGITAGSDGALWFTNLDGDSIGRITTAGAVSQFVGPQIDAPWGIAAGSDGALWFTNIARDAIGRVTTAGAFSDFTGVSIDEPSDIVTGSDGNLWFTNVRNSTIGRITPGGVTSTFGDPTISSPAAIAAGPDGALWFTNRAGSSIGRITTSGTVTNFTDGAVTNPGGITAGPDGALWFANGASIGRITTAGVVSTYAVPGMFSVDITAGPDGALWFTDRGTASIGRITTGGTITTYSLPAFMGDPKEIVAGPDGALWFTTETRIGRIGTDGAYSAFAPDLVEAPEYLTPGADGGLWYTGRGDATLGRITTAGVAAGLEGVPVTGPLTSGPDGSLWIGGAHSIRKVAALGVPNLPRSVTAVAGKRSATVSWAPPAAPGGEITAYTVTADPGGSTCTWSAGPLACTMALEPGIKYAFTVTATNELGVSAPSASSGAVVPWVGSAFHPMVPFRALDTRTALGFAGPLQAGVPRDLVLHGVNGVPVTATAVVMNLTVTDATSGSFVTVWPAGQPPPQSSNVNFAAGQTIANLVTVQVGAGGAVTFANAVGDVAVVGDVVGYYDDTATGGDLFKPLVPRRVFDSRPGEGGPGPLAAGAPVSVPIKTGSPYPLPANATTVIANVTVTGATAGSYLSVWPTGVAQPTSSNLNFAPGQTIANLVTAKIGPDGAINVANAVGAADVIVDVVGFYDSSGGSRFYPLAPTRFLDSRTGTGVSGPWGPNQTRGVVVAGPDIPTDSKAVVVNLTATEASGGSFATVFPAGSFRPASSNLNYGPGDTIANMTVVGVGTAASINLYNRHGTVHLIGDAAGYFALP